MELAMLILAVLTLVTNIISAAVAVKALQYTKRAATTRNSDGSSVTGK